MLDLCLVVVGADKHECKSFNLKHVECELHLVINNGDATSAIANRFLNRSSKTVFGLVHPDVKFGIGATRVFYGSALSGNVCGVVGRTIGLRYRWCGHNPGLVYALDDCCVFFRKDSGLTFDDVTFDKWSAHVPDLCFQAHAKGIPVVVPKATASHRGTRYFLGYQHHIKDWEVAVQKLRGKWPDIQVVTT